MERINIPTSSPFGAEFGYSRAVRLGNHIHVAGTCAQPPHDQSNAYVQAQSALQIIENALDAGASEITVELEDGGKKNITIIDNGSGLMKAWFQIS